MLCFFFFKQKTAYEMRISDWSSECALPIFMADDHAAKAIGAYGSRIVETPSIDRIAEGGKRLDHCYVTNSICTPSRASILTGTYNHVNGVTTLVTLLDNRWPNVAQSLQAGGHATAIFGK